MGPASAIGRVLRRFASHERAANTVATAPDRRQLLSGSDDGTLRLWDLASGAELRRLMGHSSLEGSDGGIWAIALAPDGRHALSGSADGTLRLCDLAAGMAVAAKTADDPIRCAVAFLDRLFVVGEQTGGIWILDWDGADAVGAASA